MEKVVVGLSGGVDSAVTAYLLKKQGYEVIGVTMQIPKEGNSEKKENGYNSDILDANKIAEQLGITNIVVDKRKQFDEIVIKYFIDSYNNGRTPNPCIKCNPMIKWNALLEVADRVGAKYVATGHYANVEKLPNGRYSISTADSVKKDQTYALFRLSQEQLARTLTPLGKYEKTEIRAIAKEAGIIVADKKDSQDMCFIPDGKYANYIRKRTGERATPGNILLQDGTVVGRHKGIIFYTVGQRKGIKLDLGRKMFVKELRPESDEVVISPIEGIYTTDVYAADINYMGIESVPKNLRAFAKIRYSHEGGYCTANITEDGLLKCVFDQPQRAITKGQGLVLYDEEGHILCGGEIVK
ncbi:MAG: tRNA 2-thiouridine(34) synthase MnmA [Lachnospiraceae bacterium]|nr:tRNA 2-thiouridine(34) synthase MnmA [Lachnospiraceae bacterium]